MTAQEAERTAAGLVATAQCLAVDAMTAQVVAAWDSDGVESILLKGPAVAAWLYGDGRPRSYGDADLLVPPGGWADATRVLEALGFEPFAYPDPAFMLHAQPYRRPTDGANVDLHRSLVGVGRSPESVWREMARRRVPMLVGGRQLQVLDLPARALVVVLHARQHAAEGETKPREDLRRALARAGDEVWQECALIADRLAAIPFFSEGLALEPDGARLSKRLPLVRAFTGEGQRSATVNVGFERLAGARGGRAKAAVALRAFVPEPASMRSWSPMARRGSVGLLAAYVVRAGGLLARVALSAGPWWRARRR